MTEKVFKSHQEANFSQSENWRLVNEKLGHKVIREEFSPTSSVLMVRRDAKRGRYLEISGGPLINWSDQKEVKTVFRRIYEIAKAEKCVFVRFRPQLIDTAENRKIIEELSSLTGLQICPASFHLHAQNTVILDLERPLEDILAAMRRQTRYEVRRSEKLALRAKKDCSEAIFREFHACQLETAKRQGFIPPSLDELLAYHTVFGEDAPIYKVTAEQAITADGKRLATPEDTAVIPAGSVICYGLILKAGKEAEYYEAASTELGHLLPGAYALQWQAIQDLKKEGYSRYNLWGIAPPDPDHPGEHLKNHRYSRVTTFKTGFGGQETNFIPAQDLIISPSHYRLTHTFETLRKHRRHLS